ncbi:MAG: DUF2236 domain-containing protein [Sphingomonadales bacterium]|nr:MAG: DUF2236 domain-containing protein [Sphingomonadales bacterium]
MFNRITEAAGNLMQPPPGMAFDFSKPRGEPALVPANSISWRIFKNPVSLFVGGVAAVILELAEPKVRSGVWDHSSFRKDAAMRLRRTGFAAMMTVYGPRSEAERMIAHVVSMHDRVRGATPDGAAYHANDPRLLDWVQATASFGFVHAYHHFARHLTSEERSRAFAEGAQAAALYGATGAPQSVEAWEAMLEDMRGALEPSPIVHEFLDLVGKAEVMPRPLRPLQRLLVRAAVEITPFWVRERLGLAGSRQGLSRAERGFVRMLAHLADRVPLRTAPPAQASVRMGLPADALYGRAAAS